MMSERLVEQWLIPYVNPLIDRFGRAFFSAVPKDCGVYFMKGEQNDILYVGKAKNLKNRLMSYSRLHPDHCGRKLLRMIRMVQKIEWEILPNETSALLRENELLRTIRPFYNVINTVPHTYHFIHFRKNERGFQFFLDLKLDPSFENAYGAFKGMGRLFRAHQALMRLFWITYRECRNGFELPSVLTRRKNLNHYTFEFPSEMSVLDLKNIEKSLKHFFKGTSRRLLLNFVRLILQKQGLALFMTRIIQDDLDTLKDFYISGPRRHHKIKKKLGLQSHLISQEKVDDFLVLYRQA